MQNTFLLLIIVGMNKNMKTKKITRIFMFLLVPIILSGCMTTEKMNQIMSSWVGSHIGDLIADWGPPAQVIDDGSGGKIYCYQYSSTVYMPGTTSTYGNAYSYGNTATFNTSSYSSPGYSIPINKSRMFWVDKDGIIYRWSWKGF